MCESGCLSLGGAAMELVEDEIHWRKQPPHSPAPPMESQALRMDDLRSVGD